MESEQRGRASRASSTSSLGREVRCGCQYYQSDSLLPERRALIGRPPSRTMQQPPAVRCSEHEYEPIAAPPPPASEHSQLHLYTTTMTTAPVVRITETDVVIVADSDDSIDDRTHLPPELTKEGDVVLPLDGKIEDSAMEGRELVETGDTSEELESPQEFQDRLEERFLNAPTPGGESRTDAEVNTSQVDSLALEELPLRRGARGLPQRIKTQAGKLRSRLRSIQRPTFAFASKQKAEKSRSTSSGKSDRSRSEKKPSRMDRIRSSFSERPRFSLPSRPKFNLPDRSKFHLPDRPKFNIAERAKLHLPERPKFNIKKPNIRLPSAFSRIGQFSSTREQEQRSTESTVGSKRNIFDFSTYPRIFDKQAKSRSSEYTTSTPKDSRAQSAESATFPRRCKTNGRWTEQFDNDVFTGEDSTTAIERSQPWRHPSIEEPRLSIRMEAEVLAAVRAIPWEEKGRHEEEEELQYMDYEQETSEVSERAPLPRYKEASNTEKEPYEPEEPELDPRFYATRDMEREIIKAESDIRPIPRSRSLDEQVSHLREDESYEESFTHERYGRHKMTSEDEEYEEDMDADEEREPSSAHSDREQQQSSGSSFDRRRRGVIEEIDSDEFFLRESGLSQDDMNLGKYLTNQIRDALRSEIDNALADDHSIPLPPQRPMRTRSLSRRKEDSVESYDIAPPARPKRERGRARQNTESGDDEASRERRSESRHRIVYQAEGTSQDVPSMEPLDDIVVVKPIRRKSKSSLRSHSQIPTDTSSLFESSGPPPRPSSPRGVSAPPVVPTRRKRSRQEIRSEQRNGNVSGICNGHTDWAKIDSVRTRSVSREAVDNQEVLTADDILASSQDDIQRLLHQNEEYIEPAPVPPKRRSRSRGTSVAQDEDRTSHGAESLPEMEYTEDDILRDDIDSTRDLPGYAMIEKRGKPPRPPPPRRKRGKFATLPKPDVPKRPQRAYSTLRPTKTKESHILSEPSSTSLGGAESSAYIEIGASDTERKLFHNGEILNKIQGRPLPAPPRPPRGKKDRSLDLESPSIHEMTTESTIATQTDPLPDDMIIEEEITQAKLVVAPSTSGSQILVSTERIPSPTCMRPPPVPALPVSQRLRSEPHTELAYDTVSLKSSSPTREHEDIHDRPHLSAPHLGQPKESEDTQARMLRSALLSDETLRIANLEVGDLRVDRLSVSQIEAGKIVASEVDALVITASELRGISNALEESLSPSIINELIAIKNHLETVAASQSQHVRERSPKPLTVQKTTEEDIPPSNIPSIHEERQSDVGISDPPITEDPAKCESDEDQKVVSTDVVEVKDQTLPITRTLALTQVETKDKESTVSPTLLTTQTETKDKKPPTTQSPQIAQDTEDKYLRILDSETTLSLTSDISKEYEPSEPLAVLQPTPLTSSANSELSEGRTELPDEFIESKTHSKDPTPSSDNANVTASEEGKTDSSTGTDSEKKTSDSEKRSRRKSRSRSPSPITCHSNRQTASPVRSLPPAISVTPDTPDSTVVQSIPNELQPQRAVISYSSSVESANESLRESSQSPVATFPMGTTHFIAFPASQIPSQLLSMDEHSSQSDPTITDTTYQLVRALRLAGIKAMRHFVSYLSSITRGEETREKIREVEVTLCALLLLVAGLLIFFFTNPRTVTHYHHWDYLNPPQ